MSGWYRSKESQKKHSFVPTVCRDTSNDISILLKHFARDPLISNIFQMALICEFNLLEKPIINKPFIVRCDVTIQSFDRTVPGPPRFMLSRKNITTTEHLIQVNTFIPLDATDAIDELRMEHWKNMRESNAPIGFGNSPMALIDFHIDDDPERSIIGCLAIEHQAINMVKDGAGFQRESATSPGKTFVPLSATACIEFINTHMRADEHNQLRFVTSYQSIARPRQTVGFVGPVPYPQRIN